jgi:hypothetical protein
MFDTRYFNPAKDYLWPVPQKEIDINENLNQNPDIDLIKVPSGFIRFPMEPAPIFISILL